MREKYVYFQNNAAASVVIGELTITAVDKTAKGNLLSFSIVESGSDEVVISVSGSVGYQIISATIGTANNQTATTIKAALDASADASALVTSVSAGTTPITATVLDTHLAGGEAGVSFPLSSFAGMHPTDDDSLALYFKSMKNFDGTTSGEDEVVTSDIVTLDLIDNNSVREAMDDICKAFTSARTRPFDIVIGDDRGDDAQKISSFITAVESVTIDGANS